MNSQLYNKGENRPIILIVMENCIGRNLHLYCIISDIVLGKRMNARI